jgi:hypothetical protein
MIGRRNDSERENFEKISPNENEEASFFSISSRKKSGEK